MFAAAPHAQARFEAGRGNGVSLNAGTLPFYAYDVLFDGDANTLALRPNGAAGAAIHPAPR